MRRAAGTLLALVLGASLVHAQNAPLSLQPAPAAPKAVPKAPARHAPKAVPKGAPYEEKMEAEFDAYGVIEVGQPVETLQEAVVRRGAPGPVKRGLLRRLEE